MTAFLKIDRCGECRRERPWEWVPSILLGGKALAGTGVWRSQLRGGVCLECLAAFETKRRKDHQAQVLREHLIDLLGGEKPYREFTFERYQTTPGNQLAFEMAKAFSAARDNLYLWGPCGIGKTHLAYAIARHSLEQGRSGTILTPAQLKRQVRMKDPDDEQAAIEQLIRMEIFVLDDLGIGNETAYAQQILQEILDGRDFTDRAGLVVTSKYSLDGLALKLNDDTIPSRLAGMCTVVQVTGPDSRLNRSGTGVVHPKRNFSA